MQTLIHSDNDVFTVIFEADGLGSDRQQEALALIQQLLAEIVCHQPGFLCSHVHLSLDGDKLVNYQQWASKDAFLGFKEGAAKEVLPQVAPFGITAKPYVVAYSQHPGA